jgi:hypothetical protein
MVKTIGYNIGRRYATCTRQNRVAMTDIVALGFNPMNVIIMYGFYTIFIKNTFQRKGSGYIFLFSQKRCIFVLYFIKTNLLLMQVTLAIPNQRDWQTLMPLLERLGISYNVQAVQITEDARTKSERDWEIIMRGGSKKDNIEQFLRDFEESRQDRPLPFRD